MDSSSNNTDTGGAGWKSLVKRFAPLALLAAVMVLVFSQGWHHYLSLAVIAENRDALQAFVSDHFVLALLAFAALYVVVVALSVPGGALLSITGGFLFGWFTGGLLSVAAATLGAGIIFLIAKTSLSEMLVARAGPWLEKLRAGFQDNALSYLLFLRLVPAFPFWLVNLAPAVLGVPLGVYVLGTFFGIIPGTFAFAFLGSGLDSIIEAQKAAYDACLAAADAACRFVLNPGALLTRELILAFVVLGVVALIPVAVKKISGRRTG